jgi:hypothetical protein
MLAECFPQRETTGTRGQQNRHGRFLYGRFFCCTGPLEPFDHSGIDQHAIETSRFGTAIAIEE